MTGANEGRHIRSNTTLRVVIQPSVRRSCVVLSLLAFLDSTSICALTFGLFISLLHRSDLFYHNSLKLALLFNSISFLSWNWPPCYRTCHETKTGLFWKTPLLSIIILNCLNEGKEHCGLCINKFMINFHATKTTFVMTQMFEQVESNVFVWSVGVWGHLCISGGCE